MLGVFTPSRRNYATVRFLSCIVPLVLFSNNLFKVLILSFMHTNTVIYEV